MSNTCYLVIREEQVVLNLEAAPTEGLSYGTWTFQINRKCYSGGFSFKSLSRLTSSW